MTASELVKECENKVSWKNPEFWKKFVLFHSFTGNFEYYKGIIDDKLEENEIGKFIEICNLKIEWAKMLMGDVSTVFSIIITSIAIIFSSRIIEIKKSTDQIKAISFENILLITFLSLLVGALSFILLRAHYRAHIHAWTAFKEAAILSKNTVQKEILKNADL